MSTRIFITHGFNASPERNWFGWLAEQYTPGTVRIPRLPDASAAQLDLWLAALAEAVGRVDADTFLVGHSLGCITTLRYLERLPRPWLLGGLVLVSGFSEAIPGVPRLDHFTAQTLDAATIISNSPHRAVITSDDDVEIIPERTHRLAAALKAPVTTVPGGGHLSDKTGVTTLPEIIPILDEMLGPERVERIALGRPG